MAPIGKIYTYPNNPRAAKALIAAKYAGVEIEVPEFKMGEDNRKPEFVAKFPLGKVPTFETAAGEAIFESNAIAVYAAAFKEELLGKTALEKAQVAQFLALADNEIAGPLGVWVYPILGYIKYNKDAHEKAVADLKRVFTALDTYLATRTYLVGESITLADIVLACTLVRGYAMVWDPAFRAPFVNLNRYFVTIVNQPNVIAVLGEIKLTEKAVVYEPPKKEEKKKEEKPKEEKKKEEKPKKKEAEEEEEEKFDDDPKGKNPLDLLPPSSFNLEAWKRFYSNNAEADSIKYFWENIDLEGFSLWYCKYRYNEENKAVYMSCNLLNGTFQRWERARKYAFGSLCIFGEDNDNEIHGVWVFRGKEVPAEIKEADDFDSYEFTPLDHTDPKMKERFNAFLAWDEIPGVAAWHGVSTKKFDQGKLFK